MTPQTLLSDLISETCNPLDIILIVIGLYASRCVSREFDLTAYADEAHKGSGEHAYTQVIRCMMAKNPHFRVLALTATPGGTPEATQGIVDCLHISHIEARDEESLDIRNYVHKKEITKHLIPMSGDILKLRDLLIKIMQVRLCNPILKWQTYIAIQATHQDYSGSRRNAWLPRSSYAALLQKSGCFKRASCTTRPHLDLSCCQQIAAASASDGLSGMHRGFKILHMLRSRCFVVRS